MNEFLRQFREQYQGAYDDMSDTELAHAIHQKFYADLDFSEFSTKVADKYGTSAYELPPSPVPPPATQASIGPAGPMAVPNPSGTGTGDFGALIANRLTFGAAFPQRSQEIRDRAPREAAAVGLGTDIVGARAAMLALPAMAGSVGSGGLAGTVAKRAAQGAGVGGGFEITRRLLDMLNR